jgi:hypothetical protein
VPAIAHDWTCPKAGEFGEIGEIDEHSDDECAFNSNHLRTEFGLLYKI